MSEITVVQVRIDENESKELDALAKKLGISKSELIRELIKLGKKALLFNFSFDRLIKKEISLARAAAEASMSIVEFVALAKERGYTYFSYDSNELQRDIHSFNL